MFETSPRWEQINPSVFRHEQEGLRELASYLPDIDPYHLWANVEFVGTDGSINEVDALVLTPSGLYVIELKHWQGEIAGNGTEWVRRLPGGRLTPEDVSERALEGLKFSTALPHRLAMATLAARLSDLPGATALLTGPTRFVSAATR